MALPQWEVVPGRCGACIRFQKDFGGGSGKVYGHCGIKPRAGSIDSLHYQCDVYAPIPEVAPARAERAAKPKIDVFADPEELVETVGVKARRSSRRPSPARVVRRRPSREERNAEPIEWGDDSDEGEAMDRGMLREIIREAIEDSMGIGEVDMVERFVGGTVVIQPGSSETQSREIPIDALLRKIVMVRDNLRVLEQKINQHKKLDDSDRVQLQQYITRCYGSLTTFNMLFKHRDDGFRGSSS